MAELAKLQFDVRENVNKADNKKLIKEGYLLGNINGKGMDSIAIVIKKDEFRKTLREFGKNCVIKLEGKDNMEYDVMVKSIQTSPLKYDYHHVDFQHVVLTESIKAKVPVKYVGVELLESKRLLLNRIVDIIQVSGLPQDIPDEIKYDVSALKVGDNIYVKDLTFDNNIKLELDDNDLVASIIESRIEEEEAEEEVTTEDVTEDVTEAEE